MQIDSLLTSHLRYIPVTIKGLRTALWIKYLATKIPGYLSLLVALVTLQGCVAGTIIDVVSETIEAGVELTGAAVGTVVDVVTPDGDDDSD